MQPKHDHEKKYCQDLLFKLSDYVDGALNEQICADIERHLSECKNCTIVVDTLRKTIELFHEMPKSEKLPEDVRHRLFLRLNLADYLENNQPPEEKPAM